MDNQQISEPTIADMPEGKSKFPYKIVIIIAVILLLAVIAAIFFISVSSSGKDKNLQEQLDLGEQYLSELDYEQAIIAYEAAITIDPQCVEACLGLADTYIAMGDYEKALEVLERNYDLSKDNAVAKKIATVKALLNPEAKDPDVPEVSDNIAEPEFPVLTAADIQNKVEIIYQSEASKVAGSDYASAATVASLSKVPDASITYVGMGGYGSPMGMGVHFQGYTVGIQANPINGYRYVKSESATIQFTGSVYNDYLGQQVPCFNVPESGNHLIYVYYEPIN